MKFPTISPTIKGDKVQKEIIGIGIYKKKTKKRKRKMIKKK